ncbi:MAG: hypothetical protein V9G13_02290 [Marmoricola sp.]
MLKQGDKIPLTATNAAPDVNNLLTTAATVITGGLFADLNVIITQLNTGLDGNQKVVRSLLQQLDQSLTRLNARTADFDRALNSIDAAVAEPEQITSTIDDLPTLQNAVDSTLRATTSDHCAGQASTPIGRQLHGVVATQPAGRC